MDVGPLEGCWLWTAKRLPNGYGVIGEGGKRGRTLYAHRVAYEHFVGEIEEGQQLHHECGNRGCVNPNHLVALPPKEHNRIAEAVKLNEDAIELILEMRAWSNAKLARALRIDPSVVSRVRHLKAWI